MHLVLGLGVTGSAVLRALLAHHEGAIAVDDHPTDAGRRLAEDLGVELVEAPTEAGLAALVAQSGAVVPSPGVPDRHPLFGLAAAAHVPVLSEFDLAGRWDDRPIVAITGTNGKTTVTELTRQMLDASGRRAVAVGNTEVPLVAALDDPTTEVFVVEASSFRLFHSARFAPAVGTWLNLAPDHLDSHSDLEAYVAAKARLWADQTPDQIAIGNADDPLVAAHLAAARARQVTFGLEAGADNHLDGDRLVLDDGSLLARVDELARAFPHDIANALAAAASARHAGATTDGARAALLAWTGLPHRVSLVGEAGGVRWYDDSKATAPHATRAALRAFPSVVLIAGGRNKGLDLSELAEEREHVVGVVAIGEAGDEVAAAFDGVRPVRSAASMDDAVAAGRDARPTGRRSAAVTRLRVVRLVPVLRGARRRFHPRRARADRCGHMTVREGPVRGPTDEMWGERRRHPTARPVARRQRSRIHQGLFGVITALNLLGLVMVLSASSVSAQDTYGSAWYIALRQAGWLLAGTVACVVVVRVDYHRWRRWTLPALALSGVLMAMVLVPGVGVNVNGASRWLGYGPLSLQPSELAKVTVLLFTADLLARRSAWIGDLRLTLVPVGVVFGGFALLLMLQPNLGTTLVLGAIVVSVLYVAGTPLVPLAGVGLGGLVAAAGLAIECQLPAGPRDGVPAPVGRPPEHRLPEHPVPRRHRVRWSHRRGPRREPGQVGLPALRPHRLHLRHHR